MVCKNKWLALAKELEGLTKLAPEGVDGAARCIKPECNRPLLKDGRCVMGHAQTHRQVMAVGDSLGAELSDALLCLVDEMYSEGLDLEADQRVIYARHALVEARQGLPGFTEAGPGWVLTEWQEGVGKSQVIDRRVVWAGSAEMVRAEVEAGPPLVEGQRRTEVLPLADYVAREIPPSLRGQPGCEMQSAVVNLVSVLRDQRDVADRMGFDLASDPRMAGAARYIDLTQRPAPLTEAELLAPFGRPDHLCDFAAQAAAKELADNWSAALGDGYSLDTLLHDVDDVTRQLQEWKQMLATGHGVTVPEGGIGYGSAPRLLEKPLTAAELEGLVGERQLIVTVPMRLEDYVDTRRVSDDVGDDLLLDALHERVFGADYAPVSLGDLDYEETGFRQGPKGPELLFRITIDLTGLQEDVAQERAAEFYGDLSLSPADRAELERRIREQENESPGKEG